MSVRQNSKTILQQLDNDDDGDLFYRSCSTILFLLWVTFWTVIYNVFRGTKVPNFDFC